MINRSLVGLSSLHLDSNQRRNRDSQLVFSHLIVSVALASLVLISEEAAANPMIRWSFIESYAVAMIGGVNLAIAYPSQPSTLKLLALVCSIAVTVVLVLQEFIAKKTDCFKLICSYYLVGMLFFPLGVVSFQKYPHFFSLTIV